MTRTIIEQQSAFLNYLKELELYEAIEPIKKSKNFYEINFDYKMFKIRVTLKLDEEGYFISTRCETTLSDISLTNYYFNKELYNEDNKTHKSIFIEQNKNIRRILNLLYNV